MRWSADGAPYSNNTQPDRRDALSNVHASPVLMQRLTQSYVSHGQLRVVGIYNTPSETPLTRIRVYPGIISYEDLQPLISADGAPIAATGKGTWGQLWAAGRGY